jgi:hypothetical protein
MTEAHKPPTHTTNNRGYEERDANVASLGKYGIGLAIISAVVLALMLWLQNFFTAQTKRAMPAVSPLATQRQAPAAPRLQVRPEKDLHDIRVAEDSVLHSYGWIVRDSGIVRLPIERAMELTAQRGLPVRAEGAERGAKGEGRKVKAENGGLQP